MSMLTLCLQFLKIEPSQTSRSCRSFRLSYLSSTTSCGCYTLLTSSTAHSWLLESCVTCNGRSSDSVRQVITGLKELCRGQLRESKERWSSSQSLSWQERRELHQLDLVLATTMVGLSRDQGDTFTKKEMIMAAISHIKAQASMEDSVAEATSAKSVGDTFEKAFRHTLTYSGHPKYTQTS